VFVVVAPETASETLTLALMEFCPTVNVSTDASGDTLMYAMHAVTKINYAYVKIFETQHLHLPLYSALIVVQTSLNAILILI